MIQAIFAVDDKLGFGQGGKLPWPNIPEDMEHFVQHTKGKTLIMGKNTYKGLPINPSEERPFHVMTRYLKDSEKNVSFGSIIPEEGIIIGGATILNQPRFLERCSEVYVTRVKGVHNADTKIEQSTMDYLEAHFSKTLIKSTKLCTIWVYYK